MLITCPFQLASCITNNKKPTLIRKSNYKIVSRYKYDVVFSSYHMMTAPYLLYFVGTP